MNDPKPPAVRTFFFGCWNPEMLGHYLHDRQGRHADASALGFDEWIFDSTFAPRDSGQIQGRAKLWHIPGWTIVAFWDRTADSRHGSNGLFLIEAAGLEFEPAMAVAKEAFPSIFERLRWPLKMA